MLLGLPGHSVNISLFRGVDVTTPDEASDDWKLGKS